MKREELTYLEEKAKRVRYLTIDEIATLGVGHAGGCMSVIEALVTIHYRHMKTGIQRIRTRKAETVSFYPKGTRDLHCTRFWQTRDILRWTC